VSSDGPMLTARFWRSRRSAALAGIVFAVLLLAAMAMMRIALSGESLQSLQSDAHRRRLIRLSLNLVLLFLAMLFEGAVTSTGVMEMLSGSNVNADIFAFSRSTTEVLISVYAMRMAAVFTLSVSTLGLRTSGIPRWVCYLGYLVALVLLLAGSAQRWTQLLFPAWVLLLSIVILCTRPPVRAEGTPLTAGRSTAAPSSGP